MGEYTKKDLALAALLGFLGGGTATAFVWLLCVML